MNLTIHQPNFFPRLKIMQKLASSQTWVVMDRVQYVKQEWQNRAKIIPMYGSHKEYWLSVPVALQDGMKTIIKDVHKTPRNKKEPTFAQKTLRSIAGAFSKAPFWIELKQLIDKVYPFLEENRLVDINVNISKELLGLTGKLPKIIYASDLPINGKGSELVANICDYLHADTYLCDTGGSRYLDTSYFKTTKIIWQEWEEPVSNWVEIKSWRDISCLNYIAREGLSKFIEHLNSGNFTTERYPS